MEVTDGSRFQQARLLHLARLIAPCSHDVRLMPPHRRAIALQAARDSRVQLIVGVGPVPVHADGAAGRQRDAR